MLVNSPPLNCTELRFRNFTHPPAINSTMGCVAASTGANSTCASFFGGSRICCCSNTGCGFTPMPTTTTTTTTTTRTTTRTSTTLTGDWFLGAAGQSCTTVCRGREPCHLRSMLGVNSSAAFEFARRKFVSEPACSHYKVLARTFAPNFGADDNGCVLVDSTVNATTCDATFSDKRICCCSLTGCRLGKLCRFTPAWLGLMLFSPLQVETPTPIPTITTTSPHHRTTSPPLHLTTSPPHHLTTSPPHHLTTE